MGTENYRQRHVAIRAQSFLWSYFRRERYQKCKEMQAAAPFLCLLLLPLTEGNGNTKDFFSSTVTAPHLVHTHNHLVQLVQKFYDAMNDVTAVLSRFLNSVDMTYVSEPWGSDGDPLRTYHLIKRTSFDVNQIVDVIRYLRSQDPLLEMENLQHSHTLPELEDFRGIAQALVRLQKVYKLDPKQLAQGKITENLQLPIKLSAADCLFLGQTAEYQEDMKEKEDMGNEAILWYEAGLALTSDEPSDSELKAHFHTELARLHSQKQLGIPALDITQRGSIPGLLNLNSSWDEVLINYRRLCRGEKIRPPSMDKNIKCHFRRGPHPYLKLRPLKVEELSIDPYLVLLHDIITEEEVKVIKNEAVPLMERSSHVGENEGSERSDLRVSVTSWIEDYRIPSLVSRLEAMTGMATNTLDFSAEQFQVLNYGIGGHYTPHYDYFETRSHDPIFTSSGDRIATLMIYLSDVEAGGATAFPYIGLTLWPKKGSAAFWWNLRNTGEGDPLTTHGACPVLYGTKWVSNKWFRTHSQMFRVPCDRRPQNTMGRL